MYEEARRLAELLTGLGVYEKVVLHETGAECIVLVAKRGERLHVIALSRHDDWIYAKVAHADAIPSAHWTCNNIYYTPYGLYAFATSVEELAEKIAAKQERLEAQARILEKALREAGTLE